MTTPRDAVGPSLHAAASAPTEKTPPVRLARGDTVWLNGRRFEAETRTGAGQVLLRTPDGNLFEVKTDGEIVDLYVEGQLRIEPANRRRLDPARALLLEVDLARFTEAERAEARRRLSYLRAWEEAGLMGCRKVELERFIGEQAKTAGDPAPPSRSSFHAWKRDWLNAGRDIRALMPRTRDRGPGPQLSEEVETVIAEVIDEVWLVPESTNACDVHAAAVARLAELNARRPKNRQLKAPCLRTVRRRMTQRDPYDVVKAKQGGQAAHHEYGSTGTTPAATRPLEVVEIDHTRLDNYAVDPKLRILLGRPWLTAAIDRYSRVPLALLVSFEPASWLRVLSALVMIATPKHEQLKRCKLNLPWPYYGVPETIVVDQGKEFVSVHMSEAVEALGTYVYPAPKKTPQYKARVERFLRTLNSGLIHKLPGTSFSNPQDRGDYPSQDKAVLTVQDIERLIVSWALTVYAKSPHAGLADVPDRVWRQGVLGFEGIRLPSLSPNRLRALLGYTVKRRLQHYGLDFLRLRYQSDGVQTLRRVHPSVRKFKVKLDPSELGTVWVIDPGTGTAVPAHCTRQDYAAGLSMAHHRILRAYVDKQIGGVITVEKLCQAREILRREVAQMVVKGKLLKRTQLARLAGDESLESLIGTVSSGAPSIQAVQLAEALEEDEEALLTKDELLDLPIDWRETAPGDDTSPGKDHASCTLRCQDEEDDWGLIDLPSEPLSHGGAS